MTLIRCLASSITTSIVLFSGTVARRPLHGSVWPSIAAAGVEGAVRSLALELAPVRVNAVAPGAIDTPLLTRVLGPDKEKRAAALAARLPVGRIGTPRDAAAAVLFVMTNPFVTGTTLEIDGGATLV
jgi:NAD(P)-dependent dehydrogenase (short-subunit alcohol dehydrogenase family)